MIRLSLLLCLAAAQSARGLRCISTDICALRGLTVDIRCIHGKSPAANGVSVKPGKVVWFTEVQGQLPVDLRDDPAYSSRVKYFCDRTTCTLWIAAVRESDSAVYRFAFRRNSKRKLDLSPGVSLSVTGPDVQVQVRRSHLVYADLFCRSSCFLPRHQSYVWYKNGQKVVDETLALYPDFFDPSDSVSCALSAFEDFPAPTVCVIDESCNRVSYSTRTICALRGSSVNISANYSSSEDHFERKTWSCRGCPVQWPSPSSPGDTGKDSEYVGRVQVLEPERGLSTLMITDLRNIDSAEYRFTFTSRGFEWTSDLPGTTLTVSGLQVQVNKAAMQLSSTEVELSCLIGCTPSTHPVYVWLKNGQKTHQVTARYRDRLQPGDKVSCALQGHEVYSSPAVYAPQFPSVSFRPPGDIIEGTRVTLTCSSDAHITASYSWYKGNLNPVHIKSGSDLVFSSIRSLDSGHYFCAAQNQLGTRMTQHIIDVKYGPKFSSVSVRPAAEVLEGAFVTLNCSSNANPAANHTWYRGNQVLLSRGPVLDLINIGPEDSGNYSCRSKNLHGEEDSVPVFVDVQYAPRPPSMSVRPSSVLVEGGSMTLTCRSDANPEADYIWYTEGKDAEPAASGPDFTISPIRTEDSGNYRCKAWNSRGHQSVTLHLLVVAASKEASRLRSDMVKVYVFILLCLVVFLLCFCYVVKSRRMTLHSVLTEGEREDEPVLLLNTNLS
ncbi:sialoadhesin-like isoform X2 [Nelusetta ayraudi]|uniref:sialoadhesin-like isoform X2 n=1 Tax=Nelusetta ayraudi TaxID=303726 RepID=UPI003F72FE6E